MTTKFEMPPIPEPLNFGRLDAGDYFILDKDIYQKTTPLHNCDRLAINTRSGQLIEVEKRVTVIQIKHLTVTYTT